MHILSFLVFLIVLFTKSTSITWTSRGCFQDATNNGRIMQGPARVEFAGMTTQKCGEFCASYGFMYFGTQFGETCFCSNTAPPGVPILNIFCATNCAGDSNSKCGGFLTSNVYQIDASFASTVTDAANQYPVVAPAPQRTWKSSVANCLGNRVLRDMLRLEVLPFSDEQCAQFCARYKFKYFGNELSTATNSYWCWCGNNYFPPPSCPLQVAVNFYEFVVTTTSSPSGQPLMNQTTNPTMTPTSTSTRNLTQNPTRNPSTSRSPGVSTPSPTTAIQYTAILRGTTKALAAAACNEIGLNLASIKTVGEFEEAKRMCGDNACWVGATRSNREQAFLWDLDKIRIPNSNSNDSSAFARWCRGGPVLQGRCLTLRPASADCWEDRDCASNAYALCDDRYLQCRVPPTTLTQAPTKSTTKSPTTSPIRPPTKSPTTPPTKSPTTSPTRIAVESRGPDLGNPPQIDFTVNHERERIIARYAPLHVYDQRRKKTIVNMTTRMFCWKSACTIPAVSFVMYPSVTARIEICNGLTGLGKEEMTESFVEGLGYTPLKDQDVVNIHTHGLHVNPAQDDVIGRFANPFCPSGRNSGNGGGCVDPDGTGDNYECINYEFTLPSYHYPGPCWWHSHWHGSVALQVSGGMYGAIDVRSEQYPDTMTSSWFMVNYLHVVDSTNCTCVADGGGSRPKFHPYANLNNNFGPFRRRNEREGFPIPSRCALSCLYSNESSQSSGMDYTTSVPNGTAEFYLVNGKYQPTQNMTVGVWHQFRIVMVAINYLFLQVPNASECDSYLVSTDGIAFDNTTKPQGAHAFAGPRDINQKPYFGTIVLPVGGRADIAIRCRYPKRYPLMALEVSINKSPFVTRRAQNFTFDKFSEPNRAALRALKDVSFDCQETTRFFEIPTAEIDFMLADLDVSGDPNNFANTPPPMNVPLHSSCPYLAETRGISGVSVETVSQNPISGAMDTYNLVFPSRPFRNPNFRVANPFTNVTRPWMATGMNNVTFHESVPLATVQSDRVHEWTVYIRYHPFHHHTWPFQAQQPFPDWRLSPVRSLRDSTGWWVHGGDWRDVIGVYGSLIVRVNYVASGRDASSFLNGKLVIHCHFVIHEDFGMMQWFQLSQASTPLLTYSSGAQESRYTLNDAGSSTLVGVSVKRCVFDSATRGFRVARSSVYSNTLDTYFAFEFAELSASCFGLVFSGRSRPGVANFFVNYGVANKSAVCGSRIGIAFRLQVFRNSNFQRQFQVIPVSFNPPHDTLPNDVLGRFGLECLVPKIEEISDASSFYYEITCFVQTEQGSTFHDWFSRVFTTDQSSEKQFTWTYGEGMGNSDYDEYQNQNVASCPLSFSPSTSSLAQTNCVYGYFELMVPVRTRYLTPFISSQSAAIQDVPSASFNLTFGNSNGSLSMESLIRNGTIRAEVENSIKDVLLNEGLESQALGVKITRVGSVIVNRRRLMEIHEFSVQFKVFVFETRNTSQVDKMLAIVETGVLNSSFANNLATALQTSLGLDEKPRLVVNTESTNPLTAPPLEHTREPSHTPTVFLSHSGGTPTKCDKRSLEIGLGIGWALVGIGFCCFAVLVCKQWYLTWHVRDHQTREGSDNLDRETGEGDHMLGNPEGQHGITKSDEDIVG